MNKKITNSFRLTACAVCVTLLMSCSDDVSIEKPEREKVSEASNSLDGFASKGSEEDHTHDVSSKSDNANPNAELAGGVQDSYADDKGELNEDTQVEDDASYEAYDEPSYTVSIDTEPSEGIIRWEQPQNVAYTNARITLSSDTGETLVRDFGAGESIELYGELPDGVYGWESVITPQISDSVRAEMREVRSSGDFNAERELAARLRAEGSLPTEQEARDNVQSGSFIVLNGVVNPPEAEEQNEDE